MDICDECKEKVDRDEYDLCPDCEALIDRIIGAMSEEEKLVMREIGRL